MTEALDLSAALKRYQDVMERGAADIRQMVTLKTSEHGVGLEWGRGIRREVRADLRENGTVQVWWAIWKDQRGKDGMLRTLEEGVGYLGRWEQGLAALPRVLRTTQSRNLTGHARTMLVGGLGSY